MFWQIGGGHMGRYPEPVALLEAKGKKHMGEDEKEERRQREVHVPFLNIKAPEYLSEEQAKKFYYLSDMLVQLNIMTELDVDCLGRYIVAHDLYIGYTRVLNQLLVCADVDDIGKVQNMQSKAFQQAQSAARDLGLTVTSRCKIAIPPPRNPEDDDL